MNKTQKGVLAGAALSAVTGCQSVPPATAQSPAEEVDVRQAMVEGVNPAALAIWEVGNNAVGESGRPDASKLNSAALARVREAAQMLGTYADIMADSPRLRAAGPDLVADTVPEGVASREQIQAAIDANPTGFRAYSRAMGSEAEAILAAIADGDREGLANRLVSFDGACQACHERYWYVNR